MAVDLRKPTASETSLEQRQRIVHLSQQGHTAQEIATLVGVSRWTVGRWLRRYRQAGAVGLAYRPRRPRTPHPQTTPAAMRSRIQAIRDAHPRWGARLIRRQLLLDGQTPPAEQTIQRWLRRLGYPLVVPRTGKPLGFRQPPPAPQELRWETDHKEKGGSSISA
jgi:transposase